jgi:N6-L-threonylcarbamoyladenine synthase
MAAAHDLGSKKLALAGGVSANTRLREILINLAQENNCELYMPPLSLCGDNAAMIGAQAYFEFLDDHIADLSLNAYPTYAVDKGFGD